MLVFLVIGSASAVDENSNETISTPENNGVDTLSQSVDNGVSAAESTNDLVANDTGKELLSTTDDNILTADDTDDGTFTALTTKLNQITNNSEIILNNDYNYKTGDNSNIHVILKNVNNVVIDGKDHTITGNDNNDLYITFIESSNIIIKNINFKNIYNFDNPSSLIDYYPSTLPGYYCIVRFASVVNSSIINCNFSSINAKSNALGSAICLAGYGKETSNINISYCNFFDCRSSAGAAIYISGQYDGEGGDGSNVHHYTIDHCYFEKCYLYASARGSAMELNGQYATVSNCIFVNNDAGGGAGVIGLYRTASYATIINCSFINNTAFKAGAISAEQEYCMNTTIKDCYFEGNTASSSKGGGAILLNSQYAKIEGCNFVNNNALNGSGGALGFTASYGSIESCNFTNNTAATGGAVYFSAQSCRIDNSKFNNNTAMNGAAVEFLGSKCNITNCDFINNTASAEGGAVQFNGQNNYMGYCNYINNSASDDGGALCAKNTGTTVAYCTFTNNTAPTGKDFYSHGYKITFVGLKFNTLWLTNRNLVDEDKIINYGYGTSYSYPAAWEDDYSDSGFLDTYLDTSNGKVTVYLVGNITSLPEKLLSIPNLEIIGYDPVNNPVGATLNMSGWNHRAFTVMADNIKFTNITFKNSNITGNSSNPNGGVIYITKDNTVIDGCSFYNNSAVNGSCIIMVSGDILTVMNSTFNGNNASYGGAIYINNCTNQSMIYTSTFKDNVAYLGAGIYYNETLWYTEEDNTYISNTITNTDSEMASLYTDIYYLKANRTYRIVYVKIGGDGLGNEPDHPTTFAKGFDMVAPRGQIIFVENGETLTYSGISRSNAKFGVAFIGNNTTLEGITFNNLVQGYDVNISGFHFVNNDSCVIWQGRNGNIVNCTFTSKDESALILRGEANGVDITNSSFINNTNRALTIETSDVVLDNCTFKNNTVTNGMGSHILMTNNATGIIVKDSRFIEGNKTGILVNASNVKIINSNFTRNTGENGGAIQQINGTLTLKNNNFTNNTATVNGGAFNLVNGTSSLNDNNFINNTATVNGGAVYNNATLIIDGGSFTGNNASNGGAVYNDADLNVNDAVFKGNNATLGGALYLNNSACIKDSSFEGNTAVNGSAIYLTKNNRLELDNVVLKDNTYTEPSEGTYGSIYLNNPKNEVLTYTNLNLVDKNDIYDGNYYLNTIYISSDGSSTAWGRDSSEATTLDNAVNHILDNGKIIVTDNSGDFTLNQTFNNLTNVTIIGNNKKFNKNPDNKYLFINLK